MHDSGRAPMPGDSGVGKNFAPHMQTASGLESPLQLSAPAMPPTVVLPAMGDGLPPVLVADDDPDDTFFIQRLIKRTGVKNPVKTFDDGTEVVNYLGALAATTDDRRHAPLLLFLDL